MGKKVAGDAIESGRVAIRCRFYGPTNHRGSRIRVTRFDRPTDAYGFSRRDPHAMTVSWDHALGLTENYVSAVREYVRRAGWSGVWAVSTCEGGAVGVFVPGSADGGAMTGRMADQYRPEPGASSFTCSDCGIDQDHLARFPGDRCIDCHDVATRGMVITAADIRRAFGGRA